MFAIDPPTDSQSIAAALARLDGEVTGFFESMPPELFLAAQGESWSPAGHLRHLTKSMAPVARAMRWPRLSLAVLFGRSRTGSVSFEVIRERYHKALAGGLQAGRFGPSNRPDGLPARESRLRTLGRWRRAGGQLRVALHQWSEGDLDRYRLPHPGLGKLTVREMLFFTAYHTAHHARRVRERWALSCER